MPWPTPWVVGGANHSAEIARVLSWAAFQGQEGVLTPHDCRVLELEVPGTGVRVGPGTTNIFTRGVVPDRQSYVDVLSSDDIVAIAPTDASGPRSDLIVARVEDPNVAGAEWDPADPVNGPFQFTRVIPNVPPNTNHVSQVRPYDSAITLARVDVPGGVGSETGTIEQWMITDLRSLADPAGERLVIINNPAPPVAQAAYVEFNPSLADPEYNPVGPGGSDNVHDYLNANTTAWQSWPDAAEWNVPVPSWATSMDVECQVFGAQILDGDIYGNMQMLVNGAGTDLSTVAIDYVQVPSRHNLAYGVTVPVASSLRGRVVTFRLRVKHAYTGPGRLDAKGGTTSKLAVNFQRHPD